MPSFTIDPVIKFLFVNSSFRKKIQKSKFHFWVNTFFIDQEGVVVKVIDVNGRKHKTKIEF